MKTLNAKAARKIASDERLRHEEAEKKRIWLMEMQEAHLRQRELDRARELAAQARLSTRVRRSYRKAIFLAAVDGLVSVRVDAAHFGYVEDDFVHAGFKVMGEVVDAIRGFEWDHYKATSLYVNACSTRSDLITGANMFWLSNKNGQLFLSMISEEIAGVAGIGRDSIEISIKKVQRSVLRMDGIGEEMVDVFAPVCDIAYKSQLSISIPLGLDEIVEMFKMLGYETILSGPPNHESSFSLKLSW